MADQSAQSAQARGAAQPQYEIVRIKAIRVSRGEYNFLILWATGEETWEPIESLGGSLQHQEIQAFKAKHPDLFEKLKAKKREADEKKGRARSPSPQIRPFSNLLESEEEEDEASNLGLSSDDEMEDESDEEWFIEGQGMGVNFSQIEKKEEGRDISRIKKEEIGTFHQMTFDEVKREDFDEPRPEALDEPQSASFDELQPEAFDEPQPEVVEEPFAGNNDNAGENEGAQEEIPPGLQRAVELLNNVFESLIAQ